jgi:hypothetical protein
MLDYKIIIGLESMEYAQNIYVVTLSFNEIRRRR